MLKKTLISAVLIITTTIVLSAKSKDPLIFEFYPRAGVVLDKKKTVDKIGKAYGYGFTAGIGKRTDGSQYWETFFGLPKYGVYFTYNHFSNSTYGNNYAIYPYFEGPILVNGKFAVNYNFGVGLAWHTKIWNKQTDPFNYDIGSPLTVAIDVSVSADYQITRHLGLVAGVGMIHYSNGLTRFPNNGMNLGSLIFGVRYQIQPQPEPWTWVIDRPEYPKNEIYTSISPSSVQNPQVGENSKKRYFCATYEVGYKRRFHPCLKWGTGFDVVYTGTEKYKTEPSKRSNLNNISILAFASMEMYMGRFSVKGAVGFYPVYSYKEKNICERIGVMYNFGSNQNQFTGVMVKATYGQVDFIEWTYGLKLWSW